MDEAGMAITVTLIVTTIVIIFCYVSHNRIWRDGF